MIIPYEGSLAGMFPLGDPARADHQYRTMGSEAVAQAAKEAALRAIQNPISRSGALPVDLITQQLQKIEGLLRRLAADCHATFELGAPEDTAATGTPRPRRRFWRGKWLWIGAGVAMAAAAGVSCQESIARLLGLAGE
jgi:hypothetical protein